MWLQTNSFGRLGYMVALCLLAMSLTACGYGFGSESASVLTPASPGVKPTIKVKSVENPTLYPWLSYALRSELRDELAARNMATWVDSGKADYEIALKVDSFTIRSWLTDSDDATSLYSANMNVIAIVYKGDTNEEVWRSSNISYSQSYESVQERAVAADLTRELVRRLVLNMRRAF